MAWCYHLSQNTDIFGRTDSSSTPTTIRAYEAGLGYHSAMFPVKKDDYWKVSLGTPDSYYIYWIPLGNGRVPVKQQRLTKPWLCKQRGSAE